MTTRPFPTGPGLWLRQEPHYLHAVNVYKDVAVYDGPRLSLGWQDSGHWRSPRDDGYWIREVRADDVPAAEVEALTLELDHLRRVVALERNDESAALPGWHWNPHARYWFSDDGWGIWRGNSASWHTFLGRTKNDYDGCPVDLRGSRAFPTVWDAMNGTPDPGKLVRHLLSKEVNVEKIKRAFDVGEVQFHRLNDDGENDPYLGENEERDRLARAFDALRRLDEEVRHRAEAIFKTNRLAGHGFTGSVHFSYAKEWDKFGSKP